MREFSKSEVEKESEKCRARGARGVCAIVCRSLLPQSHRGRRTHIVSILNFGEVAERLIAPQC